MQNSTRPGHRQDIDGLRAVAVLIVIAFHAFPSWVPGGFIGVDVFFVISGYLITLLIMHGLEQKNFSYWVFYASRVRRLYPSLIVVLVACQVFGWFALIADEYKVLGKHIAAGAIFIPNLIFWSESGYFDYAATSKPLLHLWSLGIEAQFYLLWPAIIWLTLKCNVSLLKVASGTLLASLLLNLLTVEANVSATFFSPLTRMWELLSGCLLALLIKNKVINFELLKEKLGSTTMVDHGFSTAGLLLIAYGIFFLDQDIFFPGAWALIPTVGTVLIILASENSWLNRRLLSNRFLVGIGLISFPLYLWHWPLLSFAVILEGTQPDKHIRITLVIMAFVLASLTYYFLERPIRFGRHTRSKAYLSVAVMIVVGSTGLATYTQDGFQERISHKEVKAQLADLKFDLPESTGWYCEDLEHDSPRCHSTGPNPSVVVIGDSHALMIYSALRERFKAKGQDIGLYGGSDGCPPLLNVIIQDKGGDPRHCLKKGSLAIQRIIDDPAIREVIITSRGPMYTTAKGFGDVEMDQFGSWVLHFKGEEPHARDNESVFSIGLSQTIDALIAAGKKITFLHDVPELGFDIRRCSSFRPLSIVKNSDDDCSVSRTVFEARTKSFKEMADKLLAQRPSVKVIHLAEALCDQELCHGSKDGVLFYIDDDHLSHRGAAFVVDRLWDKF
jgi:peptidoglycan/LPS O-acetylase OafA/YrhL